MNIIYEDNHLIIINKAPGELSQSDKTKDISLVDELKNYLKVKYNKQGNAYLGLFLGCTSTLGEIIGIPLDIRHITFASGNFGLAYQTIGNQLSQIQVIESFIGIILIGTMNFTFSFGLAIITAIKSRKLQVKRTGTLLYFTLRLFLHNPVAFFIPVKLDKKMF